MCDFFQMMGIKSEAHDGLVVDEQTVLKRIP